MVLSKLRHGEQQGKGSGSKGRQRQRRRWHAHIRAEDHGRLWSIEQEQQRGARVLPEQRSRGEGRLAAAHGCREGQQRRQRQGAGRGSTQPWQGGGDGLLMEEGAREKEVARRKEKGTELIAVGG